jgi:hypothetical protein
MLAETMVDRAVEAIIAAAAVEIAIASHDRTMGVGKCGGRRPSTRRLIWRAARVQRRVSHAPD